ncbi:SulP family inorganic anion transporter [Texcoconibacillus texcoconensis]|uniref:SulP family sulfate permease n=1 Tax=Texcoconibacillus texcoconensis TaxID=1095777 RepID=A0A840QRU2_9BACI|nr:SulP family inorganic anion transporter [Texcoconibacillus texcoconensis]MBB5174007.1 SulP family sulfate permease [Texcoconibacillus texcoconensis]
MILALLKKHWLSNVKGDVMAGIVVALALIPEAIAFSIIAGVDPMVGLYASFCISVIIAIAGGRPGMISGSTGAMALLMVTLVAEHGLEYLLAATILTGVLQVLAGVTKLARFMKFVPRSVMVGFVNALAILIFMSQLDHFENATWAMYALVAVTLAIIYLFPKVSKTVPSTLVAIIVVTGIVLITNAGVYSVGDMGALPNTLPVFALPDIPLTLETLMIILPYSLTLTMVGLLESLLTAAIVDDMTDTDSDKNRESTGQGVANMVTGCFGGMAGCAMIGQSVINVKSGGRGRLSSLVAGVVLMFFILVLGDLVVQIPVAALAGVMIMVSIGTFDWHSLATIHKVPRTDATVMLVTVGTVVVTHDLAIGVLAGVVLSAIFFVAKISHVRVKASLEDNGKTKRYRVSGPLFFAACESFQKSFGLVEDEVEKVIIDFSASQLWDDSAVAAIEKVMMKYKQRDIEVEVTGLNEHSSSLAKQMKLGDNPNMSAH